MPLSTGGVNKRRKPCVFKKDVYCDLDYCPVLLGFGCPYFRVRDYVIST